MALNPNFNEFRSRFLKVNEPLVEQMDEMVVEARTKLEEHFVKIPNSLVPLDAVPNEAKEETEKARETSAAARERAKEAEKKAAEMKESAMKAREVHDQADAELLKAEEGAVVAKGNHNTASQRDGEAKAALRAAEEALCDAQEECDSAEAEAKHRSVDAACKARCEECRKRLEKARASVVEARRAADEAAEKAKKATEELEKATVKVAGAQAVAKTAKTALKEIEVQSNSADDEARARTIAAITAESELRQLESTPALLEAFIRHQGIGAQMLKLATQLNKTVAMDEASRLILSTPGVLESILLRLFKGVKVRALAADTEGLRQSVLTELEDKPKEFFSRALVDKFIEEHDLETPENEQLAARRGSGKEMIKA